MFRLPLPFVLLAAPATAYAQQADPELSLEHRMLVRCSAAFAMVAMGQDNGNAEALAYPDVRESGREFFVQAGVRLIDEAGLSREQIAILLQAEVQAIWDDDLLADIMPPCLALLPT